MTKVNCLATLALLIVLGCQKKDYPIENLPTEDLTAVLDIINLIDSAKDVKQTPFELKSTDSIAAILKGKKFCRCGPGHSSDQAHFHAKSTMAFARDGRTPYIGLLKRYELNIDTDHNESLKPCYLFYINTNNLQFKNCQHFLAKDGTESFKILCIGNKEIAYDLSSEDTQDHDSPPDEECHELVSEHH